MRRNQEQRAEKWLVKRWAGRPEGVRTHRISCHGCYGLEFGEDARDRELGRGKHHALGTPTSLGGHRHTHTHIHTYAFSFTGQYSPPPPSTVHELKTLVKACV